MSIGHMDRAIKYLGITPTEKLVLIILANYADPETDDAFPSHNRVSDLTGLARETVLRTCKSLEARGLIRIQPRSRQDGSATSNLYFVFPPVTEDHTGCDGGSREGVTEDHTNEPLDNKLKIKSDIKVQADLFGNAEVAKPPSLKESFAAFWSDYPRKVGRDKAFTSFEKAFLKNKGASKILSGLFAYSELWRLSGTETGFIPHAATWLNQGRFNDDITSDIDAARQSNLGGRPSGGQGNSGGNRSSGGWSSHLPRGYDDPQGGANGGPTIIEGEFTTKR